MALVAVGSRSAVFFLHRVFIQLNVRLMAEADLAKALGQRLVSPIRTRLPDRLFFTRERLVAESIMSGSNANGWTIPAAIKSMLRRRWQRNEILASSRTQNPLFPLRLPFKGPSSAQISADFGAASDWIAEWGNQKVISIERRTFFHRLFGENHQGDRDEYLSTMHGFDEFLGNLYHLNAEDGRKTRTNPGNMVLPAAIIADAKMTLCGPSAR